jgi:hypothetical protein
VRETSHDWPMMTTHAEIKGFETKWGDSGRGTITAIINGRASPAAELHRALLTTVTVPVTDVRAMQETFRELHAHKRMDKRELL